MEADEFGLGIVPPAGEQGEGSGIGDVLGKNRLVEIEADAYDAGPDFLAAEYVLDEDAADLAVSDIDVVGPFDTGFHPFVREIEAEGEGHRLGDEQGVAGSQRGQRPFAAELEDHAEGKVLTGPAMPLVVPLSAARRLTSGGYD